MLHAPCNNPTMCIGTYCAFLWGCGGCVICNLRKRALQGDMTKYLCYQGYAGYNRNPNSPTEQNSCVKSCPSCCACLEASCCPCASLTATKMLLVDERKLSLDPCDNCIVNFTVGCAVCACVWKYIYCTFRYLTLCCLCTYLCFPYLCELIENFPALVACCVGCVTMSCMAAQIDLELTNIPKPTDAPQDQTMEAEKVPTAAPVAQ